MFYPSDKSREHSRLTIRAQLEFVGLTSQQLLKEELFDQEPMHSETSLKGSRCNEALGFD